MTECLRNPLLKGNYDLLVFTDGILSSVDPLSGPSHNLAWVGGSKSVTLSGLQTDTLVVNDNDSMFNDTIDNYHGQIADSNGQQTAVNSIGGISAGSLYTL